jgi:hypothetical protein
MLTTNRQPIALSEPYVGSLDQPGKGKITRQAGSLRKAVLDSVIHELRTPLTSIHTSVNCVCELAIRNRSSWRSLEQLAFGSCRAGMWLRFASRMILLNASARFFRPSLVGGNASLLISAL